MKIQVENKEELLKMAKDLKTFVNQHKVIVLRGVEELSKDDFLQFSRIVAGKDNDADRFISWDFGILMELIESDSPKNYLFSNEAVPFHWDGAFHEVPNILVFNAMTSIKTGRTLFFDTEKFLEDQSVEKIERLKKIEITYETEKVAHYGGKITQQLIENHPITHKNILRLGEEVSSFKNPVFRTFKSEDDAHLIKGIEGELYQEKYLYAHEWKKGDILLADNFSLLHGREGFVSSSKKRHLRRLQIR